MYSDRAKKKSGALALVLALLLLALLVALSFGHAGRDVSEEGAAAIREAVRRSALRIRTLLIPEGASQSTTSPPDAANLRP